ncbi:hypothetical protein [Microcoleus sp. FACHB-831]|nr:hypothetical protein [Microcoleus sp. FACHB-831]
MPTFFTMLLIAIIKLAWYYKPVNAIATPYQNAYWVFGGQYRAINLTISL